MFFQADDFVRLIVEVSQSVDRRHGNCQYELLGPLLMNGAQCRSHGRTRRNTVINDDNGTALQSRMGTTSEIPFAPAPDFSKLRIADTIELRCGDSHQPNDLLIADNERTWAIYHRAHGKLRLGGNADLTHNEQIERCVERTGNFRSYRQATARQG